MEQDDALQAPNINAIDSGDAQTTSQDSSKQQVYETLNAAISAYVQAMQTLHKASLASDADIINPAAISQAQVDRLFAEMHEAHQTWMAASGIAMKPI